MKWLCQEGPNSKKHLDWYHPIATCLVHYFVVILIGFGFHDWMISNLSLLHNIDKGSIISLLLSSYNDNEYDAISLDDSCINKSKYYYNNNNMDESSSSSSISSNRYRSIVIIFLIFYSIWLLCWRLSLYYSKNYFYRNCVFYEYTFLCNVTLVVSSLALYTGRPLIASGFCVTIGIDQLLWYVDLIVYFLCGKFPIGVSKYVFWPGTTLSSRITCTHHLWTIPLLMMTTEGIHFLSLPLSFVLMVTNVLLSRCMTPKAVVDADGIHSDDDKNKKDIDSVKYLNINLSHELWKDIKMNFLQISKDDPPVVLYLFRLLWRWQTFNTIVFACLYVFSNVFFDKPTPLC